MIENIRVSIGSASVLKLAHIMMDTPPTTAYIMTYTKEECMGNCQFCPQGNHGEEKRLSRIEWPKYIWGEFLTALKENINSSNPLKRICIQCLNYNGFYEEILYIVKEIRKISDEIPISSAIVPISKEQMQELKVAGLNRIAFSLDACTPELFYKIKGQGTGSPYHWNVHQQNLSDALEIFGKGYVTTHYIVGLGESQKEMITTLRDTIKKHILPGIFMFTPVRGTLMENRKRPPIEIFRHIQITRYLLLKDTENFNRFVFSEDTHKLIRIQDLDEQELQNIISKHIAFKTAGCPDCNRPYYNTRPSEEQDGYPRALTKSEEELIFAELKGLISHGK